MDNPYRSHAFLHITFNFHQRPLAVELEPLMTTLGDDWIRYAPNCWILYTKQPISNVYNALVSQINQFDNLLILEVVQGQQIYGWHQQWVWDWLYKPRNMPVPHMTTAHPVQIRSDQPK